MKDIKEIIHLYIGCETNYGILMGVVDGAALVRMKDGELFNGPIDAIKLILRRLSSMTEEEKIELYRFGFTHNSKGLQIKHPQGWPSFKPAQFLYLLSKGFWIFGESALDQGIIIDKATI